MAFFHLLSRKTPIPVAESFLWQISEWIFGNLQGFLKLCSPGLLFEIARRVAINLDAKGPALMHRQTHLITAVGLIVHNTGLHKSLYKA